MPKTIRPRQLCEVALVSDLDFDARSLGSVLERSGYAVRHANTMDDARDLACSGGAGAVIVMGRSSEIAAVDLCRRLHGDVAFDATTPLLVIVGNDCTRSERLEVLSAGAWETSTEPIDGEVLLLKLQRFMRLRRAVNRLNERSLVDAVTGLYSLEGLIRRSTEVAATARRRKEPLAVVAIETLKDAESEKRDASHSLDVIISLCCRNNIRAMDSLGRVGDHVFVWYANNADAQGAEAMIRRLRFAMERATSEPPAPHGEFRAGFCATPSLAAASVGAVEMLFRAMELAEGAPDGATVGESV